jgi:hypothetical protein
MKDVIRYLAPVTVCTMLALPLMAAAQTAPAIPPAITTPDKVESQLGTLDFKDGAPSRATLEKVYNHVDFTHAYDAFVNTMQGVILDAGVEKASACGDQADVRQGDEHRSAQRVVLLRDAQRNRAARTGHVA